MVGYIPPAPNENPLEWFDRAGRNAARWVFNTIWHSTLAVATSGFGKGVITTAACTLLATGLAFALFSAAPAAGLASGLLYGYTLLASHVGLIGMAIGGTMGSLSSLRKHDNHLTAQETEFLSQQYEKERSQQVSVAPQIAAAPAPAPAAPTPAPAPAQQVSNEQIAAEVKKFCTAEAERRAKPPTETICR